MVGDMSAPTTDHLTSTSAEDNSDSTLKRKRSPSINTIPPQPPPARSTAPPTKAAKTSANQLSINYLARSSNEDLPLVNRDESLPNLLHLLTLYSNVLERHESLASNLGARPLGPILIKRFERCFDAAPKILMHHQKSAASEDPSLSITWLEVIEFARSHPTQFNLSTFSEGQRVCQFYLPQKQLRVQISEEDYLFINSGRCQELIPPLPIWEDEEKEVHTCDVLEARLKELTNAADMVAARTRQLCHRLKNRRTAILERRAEGGSGTPAKAGVQQTTTAPPSSSAGFTAVNASNGRPGEESSKSSAQMRTDLLEHFESLPQNQPSSARMDNSYRREDLAAQSPAQDELKDTRPGSATAVHRMSVSGSAAASKHNFSKPLPPALESSQPFRPLCQAHMDSLPRLARVLPPCDRCRRLKMDCVKNLTSCAGCTKKHARCHWRDVTRDELATLDMLMDTSYANSPIGDEAGADDHTNSGRTDSDDEEEDPLDDLEAMRETPQHGDGSAAFRGYQQQMLGTSRNAQSEANKFLEAFSPAPASVSPLQFRIPPLFGSSAHKRHTATDDTMQVDRSNAVTGFRPVNSYLTAEADSKLRTSVHYHQAEERLQDPSHRSSMTVNARP